MNICLNSGTLGFHAKQHLPTTKRAFAAYALANFATVDTEAMRCIGMEACASAIDKATRIKTYTGQTRSTLICAVAAGAPEVRNFKALVLSQYPGAASHKVLDHISAIGNCQELTKNWKEAAVVLTMLFEDNHRAVKAWHACMPKGYHPTGVEELRTLRMVLDTLRSTRITDPHMLERFRNTWLGQW